MFYLLSPKSYWLLIFKINISADKAKLLNGFQKNKDDELLAQNCLSCSVSRSLSEPDQSMSSVHKITKDSLKNELDIRRNWGKKPGWNPLLTKNAPHIVRAPNYFRLFLKEKHHKESI